VSTGPRASLPRVVEHGTADCGVVAGDGTSQAPNFTQSRPIPVGIETDRGWWWASPASPTNAWIENSTRRQAQATPSQRQRAASATRCTRSFSRRPAPGPSAITGGQTPAVRNRPGPRTANPPLLNDEESTCRM
jgi:hypothetical protein